MKQITVIPADAVEKTVKEGRKIRAAAYARVSTDKEEQNASYEAQIDYYTKLISRDEGLEFVGVYADEGASGTGTGARAGFRRMMNDALAGGIDRIYTKSVSRFARNTVDSLVSIRRLREAGCEVCFEKENISTFDAKGELLLTILSSLAQEESRSISENVTWGTRKRFSDGKYHLRYKSFLGYEKGADGAPAINEKEAAIVRRVYWMFLEGLSPCAVAKILEGEGIPAPMGGKRWHGSVIKSILTNEKYAGNALLQKTCCVNFLTKKRVKNDGRVPRYFIENGHPAIVSKELFDEVRARFLRDEKCENDKPGTLRCGECGAKYIKVTWHKGNAAEKTVWRCGAKYRRGCRTPFLTQEQAKRLISSARRALLENEGALSSALTRLATPPEVLNAMKNEIEQIEMYEALGGHSGGRASFLRESVREMEERNARLSALPLSDAGELRRLAAEPSLERSLFFCVALFPDGSACARFPDGSSAQISG